MTIQVTKEPINLREKLNELETNKGLKGNEILQAETAQEVRSLIGAGRKNLLINGGFDVWQRGTSSTTPASGSVYRTLDRFWTLNSAGAAGTHSRSSDVPSGEGFNYSLSMTNVSGGYIGASVELTETGKASPFKPNTDYTLSFWLKGTGGALEAHYRNATATGANSTEVQSVVTFPSSVDWVKHSLTINTGTVNPHANNTHIGFDLSGFTSGGLTTGWQLELGSVATDFEHRSYGEELALCQRYFEKSYAQGVSPGTGGRTGMVGSGGTQGQTTTTEVGGGSNPFAVEKRTTPTMTYYDNAGAAGKVERLNAGIAWSSNNVNGQPFNPNTRSHSFISASGATASGVYAHFTADAEL